MFVVRPAVFSGVSFGRPSLALQRAVFHALNELHLLEDLLSFVSQSVHGGRRMTRR